MDRHSTTSSNPRVKEFGPWTEQYSSSGKRYFYNRETEVSQWEKPPEWREYERSLIENAPNHSPVSSHSGARGVPSSSQHSVQHHMSGSATNSTAYDDTKRRVKETHSTSSSQFTASQGPKAKRPKTEIKEEEDTIGPIIFNEEQHRRFFRPDLVSEILHWPSEEYEQAAAKADAAAHNLTLQIANVSCDLKCARSLVKTAEMRSTLLAQKLIFIADHLRQLETSLTLPSLPSASNC